MVFEITETETELEFVFFKNWNHNRTVIFLIGTIRYNFFYRIVTGTGTEKIKKVPFPGFDHNKIYHYVIIFVY